MKAEDANRFGDGFRFSGVMKIDVVKQAILELGERGEAD